MRPVLTGITTPPVNGDDAPDPTSEHRSLKPPTPNHMQIKSKYLLTMLVVAGISVAALPANAATFVAGDLLLGFRATGGTGSTSNLVVNLGQADTVYRDATSGIASIADLGAILTSTYGSDWATRSDLSWGVVGVRSASSLNSTVDGDPQRTNYLSIAQSAYAPGTQQSAAPTIGTGTARGDVATAINDLGLAYAAASGTTFAVLNASTANSWTDQVVTDNNFAYGASVEASSVNGIDATGLDLYRILHTTTGANPSGTIGTGSYEGTFTISSSGVVGYSVGAVPEPSRALLAACGLGGLLLRRRRPRKA